MTTAIPGLTSLDTQTHIDGSRSEVWDCLTTGINEWWPAEFYAGGDAGGRRFILEAAPGGRMFEEWENGGGLLWGTVITAEPAVRLQVTGFTFPDWGGPNQWFGSWALTDDDGGTLLSFEEHALGRIADGYVAEKTRGWEFLWQALKAHIEGTPAPIWND